MLAKLRKSECAQGFVHLMYKFLEMLGKFMELMLPSGGTVCRGSERMVPVRTQDSLTRMREYRRQGTSVDLSRSGRTRHLNPARHPFPWSPYSE
jgi:hypothetical protein